MNLKPDKGNRKVSVNFTTQIFLLVGFALAAWMKSDFNLYLAYAITISGSNFAFMWGNSKSKENLINPQNITTNSSNSSN